MSIILVNYFHSKTFIPKVSWLFVLNTLNRVPHFFFNSRFDIPYVNKFTSTLCQIWTNRSKFDSEGSTDVMRNTSCMISKKELIAVNASVLSAVFWNYLELQIWYMAAVALQYSCGTVRSRRGMSVSAVSYRGVRRVRGRCSDFRQSFYPIPSKIVKHENIQKTHYFV